MRRPRSSTSANNAFRAVAAVVVLLGCSAAWHACGGGVADSLARMSFGNLTRHDFMGARLAARHPALFKEQFFREVRWSWHNEHSAGIVALIGAAETAEYAWFDELLTLKGCLNARAFHWCDGDFAVSDRDADGNWEMLLKTGATGLIVRLLPDGSELLAAWIWRFDLPRNHGKLAASWEPREGGAWTIVSQVMPNCGNTIPDFGTLEMAWERSGALKPQGSFRSRIDVTTSTDRRIKGPLVETVLWHIVLRESESKAVLIQSWDWEMVWPSESPAEDAALNSPPTVGQALQTEVSP